MNEDGLLLRAPEGRATRRRARHLPVLLGGGAFGSGTVWIPTLLAALHECPGVDGGATCTRCTSEWRNPSPRVSVEPPPARGRAACAS